MSVYFGTWQLKQTDFYERMASWREECEGLSLNGPGVTVTNSTTFCFWWLDWSYKTATLSGVKFAHVRGLSKLFKEFEEGAPEPQQATPSDLAPSPGRLAALPWQLRNRKEETEVLNEVLFLFLCMCVVPLRIDDGRVCVRGVLCSFGLIG